MYFPAYLISFNIYIFVVVVFAVMILVDWIDFHLSSNMVHQKFAWVLNNQSIQLTVCMCVQAGIHLRGVP